MWNLFLTSNNAKWRTLRTIVQGIIGVLIANIDLIIGNFGFDASTKAVIVALVMAILSPCMKALGTDSDLRESDMGSEE